MGMVPSSEELFLFKITGKPKTYRPENLWDYINGGADVYLIYGFREVLTFAAVHEKKPSKIVVDIYDMGEPLQAYGIFSIERVPDGESAGEGSGSNMTDDVLSFWQDRYYVKIMAQEVIPGIQKDLLAMGDIISGKLPDRAFDIPYLDVFPKENRVKGTDRYMKKDVLGQDYLEEGFSMEYKRAGQETTILLIEGKTPEQSAGNLNRYRAYLDEEEKVSLDIQGVGEQAFLGKDFFYGPVIFARKNHHIIGVMGFDNQETAMNVINAMFGRLEKVSNNP
jgi:hypothetical protein